MKNLSRIYGDLCPWSAGKWKWSLFGADTEVLLDHTHPPSFPTFPAPLLFCEVLAFQSQSTSKSKLKREPPVEPTKNGLAPRRRAMTHFLPRLTASCSPSTSTFVTQQSRISSVTSTPPHKMTPDYQRPPLFESLQPLDQSEYRRGCEGTES